MSKDLSTAVTVIADTLGWTRLENVRGVWREAAKDAFDLPPDEVGGAGQAIESAATAVPDVLRQWFARVPEPFTLCVESASVLFRCLTLPTTVAAEVAGMVALQLDKLLPLPAGEMTIAFETISQDDVNTVVLACAAPTAVVERTVGRLRVGRQRMVRIDVAALACVRLLAESGLALSADREAVLLDEGGQATLVVLEGGKPVLARSVGGLRLPATEIARTVRLSLLQAEVERGPCSLERATLVAEPAAVATLREHLAVALGCDARVVAPADLGSLARGAALRSGAGCTFDLTPADWRGALADRRFRRGLLRVLCGGLLVWSVLALALFGGPTLLDARAVRLEASLKTLEAPGRAVRDVRNRVRMIQAYMDRELSPIETLREISLLLPEGIELSSFRYRREDRRISVQGSAQSTPLVYEFKQKIDTSELFGESALVSGPTSNPKTRGADFELMVLFKEAKP